MSGRDTLACPVERRTDGGTGEGVDDGSDENDDDGRDDGGGGWFSRLFPGRDERIRSLRRQLRQAEGETEDLQAEVERLQDRVEELETTERALSSENEAYRERQFAFDALLASVGRSFRRANADLEGQDVAVGDLDVTLRADVSGGGTTDSLSLRLVDPDEEVDPDRLSTVSFSVGRRGRFRHYGGAGALTRGAGGGFMTTDPSSTDEAPVPSGPPVEVPTVLGLSAEEAVAELRAAGFDVHTEDESAGDGTVVEQWPRAFAVAPKGSSVVVIVDDEEAS
ncbi:PASTA domain-containing protein [Salinigranum halophilum]|uniref:PASTA domain-containing protein n=1 Tax=Salinigranum halophilum TaxID=2565931 RepID=UPI00115E09D7|nr:PASTA domain-containing protein [Salinigranum halophilum]